MNPPLSAFPRFRSYSCPRGGLGLQLIEVGVVVTNVFFTNCSVTSAEHLRYSSSFVAEVGGSPTGLMFVFHPVACCLSSYGRYPNLIDPPPHLLLVCLSGLLSGTILTASTLSQPSALPRTGESAYCLCVAFPTLFSPEVVQASITTR